MFKEYTLSWVKNEDKTSKAGKPYTSLAVKVEGDDNFYNGFGNEMTKAWMTGDRVKLKLFEEEYNGKMYKKVETQNKSAMVMERVESLENRVAILEGNPNPAPVYKSEVAPPPERQPVPDGPALSDLPF